ncbi:MAG: hypothetical protein E6G97_17625 [Alphaproteobacteria bacterium]|nr:MAG: hypothetical protein E6G97_17625 [Alphaproteobacteria bacterium]
MGYVTGRQRRDGAWPEYMLPAGESEGWTTALIGYCLAQTGRLPPDARRRSARFLLASRTPDGWAYNRSKGADADSTAWALRCLASYGGVGEPEPWQLLLPFMDPTGAFHTFREPQFRAWSSAHADVTAVVGLALVELGAPPGLIARVRAAVLRQYPWKSYWWMTDAYAAAFACRFLVHTGGIPDDVRNALLAQPYRGAATALENALLLMAANAIEMPEARSVALVEDLLQRQLPHGAWLPSPALLLPPDGGIAGGDRSEGHADLAGLVSSAMAAAALARWVTHSRAASAFTPAIPQPAL